MTDIEKRRADEIAENLRMWREKLGNVEICAVTKTMPVSDVNAAIAAGARVIGENRVQEYLEKLPLIEGNARKHIIGRLQTNKVRQIVGKVDMIESLDSIPLAMEISKRAKSANVTINALIEINAGNEPQKGGVSADGLGTFIESVSALENIHISGLMAVMPVSDDKEALRPLFRRVRALYDECARAGYDMNMLSMGMSSDCVIAAEEGATMVRLGRAIFGNRN